MLKCDICLEPVPTGGYALTTTQVVTTSAYWEYAFTHQWAYIGRWTPSTQFLGKTIDINEVIQGTARQMSESPTPWLICDSCIQMFTVDKKYCANLADRFSREMPGGWKQITGPANFHEALAAASKAYQIISGSNQEVKNTTVTNDKINYTDSKVGVMTIQGTADTIEEAFQQALSQIPSWSTISEKRIIIYPETTILNIKSFEEIAAKNSAHYQAEESALKILYATINEKRYEAPTRKISNAFIQIKRITVKERGSKGLLGIGKQPNLYEVETTRQAFVEIDYNITT